MTAEFQLSVYNGALAACGSRALASLTENREARRLCDTHWDDDAIAYILGLADWNFAIRTERLEYDPAIAPDFGYQYGFPKPDDWVRTTGISNDEYFNSAFNGYEDEAGIIWSNDPVLYLSYVSDDSGYGSDYAKWPQSVKKVAHFYLAQLIAPRLTQSDQKELKLEKKFESALDLAKTQDARAEPTRFPQQGSWNSARRGGRRGDKARGTSLIG